MDSKFDMKCASCGNTFSPSPLLKSRRCPYCGFDLAAYRNVFGVFVFLWAFIMLLLLTMPEWAGSLDINVVQFASRTLSFFSFLFLAISLVVMWLYMRWVH